jgi:pilus assembly protein Flp/PilA
MKFSCLSTYFHVIITCNGVYSAHSGSLNGKSIRTGAEKCWNRSWHLYKRRKEVKPMLVLLPEQGQGLVEYALILVLVAVVIIVVLLLLGPAVGNMYSNIVGSL